jgi:hypothetical protein
MFAHPYCWYITAAFCNPSMIQTSASQEKLAPFLPQEESSAAFAHQECPRRLPTDPPIAPSRCHQPICSDCFIQLERSRNTCLWTSVLLQLPDFCNHPRIHPSRVTKYGWIWAGQRNIAVEQSINSSYCGKPMERCGLSLLGTRPTISSRMMHTKPLSRCCNAF